MSNLQENMSESDSARVKRPRMLVHVCCSVCACHVIELLSREFEPVIFYYNPNIHPHEEYLKRKKDIELFAEKNGIEFIEGPYDEKRWFYITEGLDKLPEGGARCDICFNIRLNQTARYAALNGIEWFTTTLTVSPHKNSRVINRIGKHLAEDYGLMFYKADFKKQNGFKKTIELAKERGFYRQDYCGCRFSYYESTERRNKNIKKQESIIVDV